MRLDIDKHLLNRLPVDKERATRYALYSLFVIAVLPVIIFRDFTPANELRYLCIADESIANGNFFAFTNNGIPYADKPPLYLWLVILCKLICGTHQMWLLSLLSLIPGLATVATMNSLCRDCLVRRDKTVASSMLLTTAYFLAMCVTLRMDMLMTMFIVLSIRSYMRLRSSGGNPRRERLLFPIWIFLAIFSKGPIGFLVPLLTTVTFSLTEKDRYTLRTAWGWRTWMVLISLCAAWFLAVYADGGTEYLDNLLFHQTMGRAVNSFHHSRPFWWYGETIWYVAAPWSLLAVYMLIRGLRNFRTISDIERLCIVSSVTTFLLLSLISGKLQVYLLPLLPFLIYGAWIETLRGGISKWAVISLIVPAALLIAVYPLLLLGDQIGIPEMFYSNRAIRIAVAILFVGGVTIIQVISSDKGVKGLGRGIILLSVSIMAAVFAAGFSLPSLRPLIGWSEAAETIESLPGYEKDCRIVGVGVDRIENMSALLKGNTPCGIDLTPKRSAKSNEERLEKDSVIIGRFIEQTSGPLIIVTDKQHLPFFNRSEAIRSGELFIIPVEPISKQPTENE